MLNSILKRIRCRPASASMVNRKRLAAFFGAWDGAESNFDPDKLTTVAMTGVTALVRATADADGNRRHSFPRGRRRPRPAHG